LEKLKRAYDAFEKAFRRFEKESLLGELIYLRNRLVHVYDEMETKALRKELLKEEVYELFKEVLFKLKP